MQIKICGPLFVAFLAGCGSTATPAPDAGGVLPEGGASSDVGSRPPTCPPLEADATFEQLQLDGTPLGRPYAAWGLSDDDFYVAVGVETNSTPSSSPLAAVLHWDGAQWSIDRLPPLINIGALAGRAGELWVSGMTDSAAPVLLRNRQSEGWQPTPLAYEILDMTLLGREDGWLAGIKSKDSSDGILYRIHSDSWIPEPAASTDQRYGFAQLEAGDAPRVYGRGHMVSGNTGSSVLGAFDGSSWKVALIPSECGYTLETLVSAAPGGVTTLAGIAGDPSQHRLCRVSSDLSSWTPLADLFAPLSKPSLVAIGAGTLLATSETLNMIGAPILVARGNAIVSCSGPVLYDSVAWVAPGSSNVHIFSATRYGPMAHGYHWVARVEP